MPGPEVVVVCKNEHLNKEKCVKSELHGRVRHSGAETQEVAWRNLDRDTLARMVVELAAT